MASILEYIDEMPAVIDADARRQQRPVHERGALVVAVFDPLLKRVLLESDEPRGMRFPTLSLGSLTVGQTLRAYLTQHPGLADHTTWFHDLGDRSRILSNTDGQTVTDTVIALAIDCSSVGAQSAGRWGYLEGNPDFNAYYYTGLLDDNTATANHAILDQVRNLPRLPLSTESPS